MSFWLLGAMAIVLYELHVVFVADVVRDNDSGCCAEVEPLAPSKLFVSGLAPHFDPCRRFGRASRRRRANAKPTETRPASCDWGNFNNSSTCKCLRTLTAGGLPFK